MKRQINPRAVSTVVAKTTTSTRSTKTAASTSHQKGRASRGGDHPARAANKGLKRQSKPESIFSYKSADDMNVLAIIDAVRTGISFTEFEKIVGNAPFSLAEWANYLQISERTIQRNQKEKKPFQPIQSERIVELMMLYEYGVDVFGDKENLNVWLNSKSIALGGRTPKELLDTKFGVAMVKDELGRIEHGVLA